MLKFQLLVGSSKYIFLYLLDVIIPVNQVIQLMLTLLKSIA